MQLILRQIFHLQLTAFSINKIIHHVQGSDNRLIEQEHFAPCLSGNRDDGVSISLRAH